MNSRILRVTDYDIGAVEVNGVELGGLIRETSSVEVALYTVSSCANQDAALIALQCGMRSI
jgi:hypothetical protein